MEICSDIMTRNPVCCVYTDTAVDAARLMRAENVGAIPVLENKFTQAVKGIVTDRDLALKVVAEGHDPYNVTVEDVMSPNLVTCYPEDDLQKAIDLMAEHQLRRIPIIDHENRILGIIAQADVATQTNQPEKTAEMVKEISL